MTSKTTVKLTTVLITIALTVGALATYRNGLGTDKGNPGREQLTEDGISDPVDSAALTRGLAELQKITDRYQHNNLMVQGEIRYYESDSATAPLEKAPFVLGVEGDNTLYELDSVLTVTSVDLALIIDKRELSIAIAEKEKLEGDESAMQPAPDAINAVKTYIRQITMSDEGQYKQLTVLFTEDVPGNMLEYVVVYDEKNYAIKKIRMKIADSELRNDLSSDEPGVKVTEDDELFMVDSANNALPTGIYASVQVVVYEIVYNQERQLQKGAIDPASYVQMRNGEYIPATKYKSFSILQ
jgi:hypothetical protein